MGGWSELSSASFLFYIDGLCLISSVIFICIYTIAEYVIPVGAL